MSLGLQLRFVDAPKGFLKRRRAPSVLIPALVTAMREAAGTIDPLLGQLIHAEAFQRGVELTLLPGLEPLHFDSSSDGFPTLSAATQGGGPGYHAYLVELLEAAAKTVGVEIGMDDPGRELREHFDETGYLVAKDFEALERSMAGWLHGVAKLLAEHADAQEIALMWPVERPRVVGHPIVTPMGPLPRDAFEEAAASVEAAGALGPRLLPWWKRGFSGEVARNIALQLGWSELRWRAPSEEDEEQRRLFELFVAAAERARALDPSLTLPDSEVAEARALLAADGEETEPAALGVGYFRGLVRAMGTGGWTFEVPGYWRDQWEEDGGTATWWCDGVTLRQSSLTAEQELPPPDPPEPTPERVAFEPLQTDELQGWAETTRVEEDGDRFLRLTGKVVSGQHLCLLTVSFQDADDRGVAERILRSLRPPAPVEPAP